MVDFDNETTVAVPAKDVMKIYLLQVKAYTEDSWRLFRQKDLSNSSMPLSNVKASLEQWYLLIEPIINRHWKPKEMGIESDQILPIIEKGTKKDIMQIIILFNRLLDNLQLIRLDTRVANLRTLEASNIAKGY